MDDDNRQLDLLAIFHYVVAGILALFGLFPIIHLVMGIALLTGSFDDGPGEEPLVLIGVLFVAVALAMIVGAWALAVAVWIAGSRLKRRVAYTYCLVVAAVECVFMPFGTVLGVLTLIVLNRPSVRMLFGACSQPSASS